MAFSIADLKKAAAAVSAAFGVSDPDGRRLVGYYSSAGKDAAVAAILAGDFDGIPAAAAALGVHLNGVNMDGGRGIPAADDLPGSGSKKPVKGGKKKSPGKDTAGRGKEKKSQKKPAADDLKSGSRGKAAAGGIDGRLADDLPETGPETVAGDVLPGDYSAGLPSDIVGRIDDAIADFCARYNIEDLSKERQPRWGAACIWVGEAVFKGSNILRDMSRTGPGGVHPYNVPRVAALVDVFGFLCRNYVKAPFIDDFAHFAGVSDSWLYGVGSPGGLTPARASLLQKIKVMQESGLAGLIADGRQNPTGALAILNHWHGWVQSREIVHTDGGGGSLAAALPVFSADGGGLIEEKPGNTAISSQ